MYANRLRFCRTISVHWRSFSIRHCTRSFVDQKFSSHTNWLRAQKNCGHFFNLISVYQFVLISVSPNLRLFIFFFCEINASIAWEWLNWNLCFAAAKAHPDHRSMPIVSPINCKHQRQHAAWTALAHRRRQHRRWPPHCPRGHYNQHRPFTIRTTVWIHGGRPAKDRMCQRELWALPFVATHNRPAMWRQFRQPCTAWLLAPSRCIPAVATAFSPIRRSWPSNQANHIPFRIPLVRYKNCPKRKMWLRLNWWREMLKPELQMGWAIANELLDCSNVIITGVSWEWFRW